MRRVEVFHIGPQKAATTWTYRALREHPEIGAPEADSIHYFDMFYARGDNWYRSFFRHAEPDQLLFDPTPSYIRSPWAPRRIADENPEARIILCMRHPIDRAFSHYWHEKKKGTITFSFEEVLANYDLFASWIEPGFYAEHIERYLRYFDRSQLLCLRFDLLENDPRLFLSEILKFIGVNEDFEPTIFHQRVNAAGTRHTLLGSAVRSLKTTVERLVPQSLVRTFDGVAEKARRAPSFHRMLANKNEHQTGVPDQIRRELLSICEPEIERLENLLGIDLADWLSEN